MIPLETKTTTKPGVPLSPSLYTASSLGVSLAVSLTYLAISYLLIGFRADQLVLVAIFNLLYFFSRVTRRFILGFSVFIVYWIIFDYMKAFPNYRFNTVHIGSLYEAEKALFGFAWKGNLVTPNEFFHTHHLPVADILAGIFYLCWVPVPLFFAGYLFFKNREFYFMFSLTFFLVNLIGFSVYYLFPAAPPWYVLEYGTRFIATTPGHTAGLSRFDALTGIPVFAGIYSKSSNVFAAMPSLHAAYMVIVVYYSHRLQMGICTFFFAFIAAGIWFAAVYSSHHYILDVVAGIGCALAGIVLLEAFARKTRVGRKILCSLVQLTQK